MDYTCHSGGADGADTLWETEGNKYNVTTVTYSFSGHVQNSPTPRTLTPTELAEGWDNVLIAEQTLKRKVHTINNNDYLKNLLSRNWFQVKNADVIYAIGRFTNIRKIHVGGGTGWAVQMAKDNNKPIYVFNLQNNAWYTWSYQFGKFLQYFPTLTIESENFAGIGTRRMNEWGVTAIKEIYKNTFQ